MPRSQWPSILWRGALPLSLPIVLLGGLYSGVFTPTEAAAVAALAADPDVARWNQASLSSGQLAKEYGFTDLDGSRPDAWRYLVEVQDPGRPAGDEGYR